MRVKAKTKKNNLVYDDSDSRCKLLIKYISPTITLFCVTAINEDSGETISFIGDYNPYGLEESIQKILRYGVNFQEFMCEWEESTL